MSLFSVDVWFMYGSVCWGVEAEIATAALGELVVCLPPALNEGATSKGFLEILQDNLRGLSRLEVKIWCNAPDAPQLPSGLSWPVSLFSEARPRLMPLQGGEALKISGLMPCTPSDGQNWLQLLAE